jgi:uncharacterized protein YndB with AHSA1/START domain
MPDKNFTVERERTIAAPPDRVKELITDFHEWKRWSPWEDVDPQLHRAYSGPESGVGARYAWSGNRKAGAGNMEITRVDDRGVGVDLEFLKPFASRNTIDFVLAPAGEGTRVTWRMTGPRPLLMRLMGPIIDMDKLVGKDFDKGLERLDEAARA